MPETRVEPIPDQLLRSVSAKAQSDWRFVPALMKELAQDQAEFAIDRGRGLETYYGRNVPSKDAQSDATFVCATSQRKMLVRAMLEAWRNRLACAWESNEPTLEIEYSYNVDALEFQSQHDDKLSVLDATTSEELTAVFLAGRLIDPDAANDWPRLRDLILLAEDTSFTPQQSAQLAPRLLELAMRYRDSNDPQDKPVVWSAIRTGASMLCPNEAGCLRSLLDPGHPVETSLVTVKMLGRIFEAQPPSNVDQYPELAAEVCQIAKSLLNRYAIASSQSAAMAQLAIYALAAMASSSILRITQFVRDLKQSWFADQVGHELRELRKYWDRRTTTVATGSRELLERAIKELGFD